MVVVVLAVSFHSQFMNVGTSALFVKDWVNITVRNIHNIYSLIVHKYFFKQKILTYYKNPKDADLHEWYGYHAGIQKARLYQTVVRSCSNELWSFEYLYSLLSGSVSGNEKHFKNSLPVHYIGCTFKIA